jgi:polyphosphate kinase
MKPAADLANHAAAAAANETGSDIDRLRDTSLYFNRELSQLDFNFRVLAQAQDPNIPLLERLRYLCISCTNLDEFFEIRAGTLRHAQDLGLAPGADGLAPATVLARIHDRAADLVAAQYECWNDVLRPALSDACCIGTPGARNRPNGFAPTSAKKSCRCCRPSASIRRIRSRRSSTSR